METEQKSPQSPKLPKLPGSPGTVKHELSDKVTNQTNLHQNTSHAQRHDVKVTYDKASVDNNLKAITGYF